MEKNPDSQPDPVGVDVPPYGEIHVPSPPVDSPARLALYEVQRERGVPPSEPMEALLQEKLEQEGLLLNIDKEPADVPAYAEFYVPTPPPDSPARLAVAEIKRERGEAPDDSRDPDVENAA